MPLTDDDVSRIVKRTGDPVTEIVRWVDRDGIDMDDEPEAFVRLRQGKRVMVLRHERGKCRYLGDDDRCTIYTSRPLGCRIFPFDATFDKKGELRRLKIVQATEECPYELDGKNDPTAIFELQNAYEAAHRRFNEKIADWNRLQRRRLRAGKAAETARRFLQYVGLATQG